MVEVEDGRAFDGIERRSGGGLQQAWGASDGGREPVEALRTQRTVVLGVKGGVLDAATREGDG
jgi:hypothetical protein